MSTGDQPYSALNQDNYCIGGFRRMAGARGNIKKKITNMTYPKHAKLLLSTHKKQIFGTTIHTSKLRLSLFFSEEIYTCQKM